MYHLTLTRNLSDVRRGTTGEIRVEGTNLKWPTIERPWIDNRPYISCIPSGEYILQPHTSVKYGEVWAVVGGTVSLHAGGSAQRFAVLVHPANYASQLQGCIALGTRTGKHIDGSYAVWNSQEALAELTAAVGFELHTLTIQWGVL